MLLTKIPHLAAGQPFFQTLCCEPALVPISGIFLPFYIRVGQYLHHSRLSILVFGRAVRELLPGFVAK